MTDHQCHPDGMYQNPLFMKRGYKYPPPTLGLSGWKNQIDLGLVKSPSNWVQVRTACVTDILDQTQLVTRPDINNQDSGSKFFNPTGSKTIFEPL
jgi:hypothetical protein